MSIKTDVYVAGWELLTAAATHLQRPELEITLQNVKMMSIQTLTLSDVERVVKILYADAVRFKLDAALDHLGRIAMVLHTILPKLADEFKLLKTEVLKQMEHTVHEALAPVTAMVQATHTGPVYVVFEVHGDGSVAKFYTDENHRAELPSATIGAHTQYPVMYRVDADDVRLSGVPSELFHLRPLVGVLNLSLLMTQTHLEELRPFQVGMIASWRWSLEQDIAKAPFALPEPHFDGSRSTGTSAGRGKGINVTLAERVQKAFTDIVHQGALGADANPLQWFLAYVDLQQTVNDKKVGYPPSAAAAAATPTSETSASTSKLHFGRQAIATDIFFRLLPQFLHQSESDAEHMNIERVTSQRDTRCLPTAVWTCTEMIELLLPGEAFADRRQMFLDMWRKSHPLLIDHAFTVLAHPKVLIAARGAHKLWPLISIPPSILARSSESALLSKERLTELKDVIGDSNLLDVYTRRHTSNPVLQRLQDFFICKAVNTAFVLPSREQWEQLLKHYRHRLTLADESGASSSRADDPAVGARCVERQWAKHFVFTVEFTHPDQLCGRLHSPSVSTRSEIICFSYLEDDRLHNHMRPEYIHDTTPLRLDSVLVLLCNAWLNALSPKKELNLLLLPSELQRITPSLTAGKKPQSLYHPDMIVQPELQKPTWLRWDQVEQPSYMATAAIQLDEFKQSAPFQWFARALREFLVPEPPAAPIGGAMHTSQPDLQWSKVAVLSHDLLLNQLAAASNRAQWLAGHPVPRYIGVMHDDLLKLYMNHGKVDGKSKLTCPVIPFFLLTNCTMQGQRHTDAMIATQRKIEAEIYFHFIAALCMFGVHKLVPKVGDAWNGIRKSAEQRANAALAAETVPASCLGGASPGRSVTPPEDGSMETDNDEQKQDEAASSGRKRKFQNEIAKSEPDDPDSKRPKE